MNKKEKKAGALTANMWIYALGLMGINLGIGLINSYQAEFFNKILQADLMAVAGIILAAKFISIVADFVIGNLIDRANFKAGKMRPWILFSAFPLAILTMISFVYIPFSSIAGRYIYIIFVVVLWNISMTMADIPSQGMLSLISKSSEEVNNAAGLGNTLKSIALAAPGVFVSFVCILTGSDGAVGKTEYLITAGIMAGLGLIFQLLMYFKCKEVVKSDTSAGMSFKEMFRELKNNKMLLIVLGRTFSASAETSDSALRCRQLAYSFATASTFPLSVWARFTATRAVGQSALRARFHQWLQSSLTPS